METEGSETEEVTGNDGDDGSVGVHVDEDGDRCWRPGIRDRMTEIGGRRSE
jgi:hypothetical protein